MQKVSQLHADRARVDAPRLYEPPADAITRSETPITFDG
jgi:hypothetical protein